MRDGVSNAPLTRNDVIHTYSWNVSHILVSQYYFSKQLTRVWKRKKQPRRHYTAPRLPGQRGVHHLATL